MEYTLIRSDRRTVSLEITPALSVLVRAPRRMGEAEVRRFVEAHAGWIERRLLRLREQAAAAPAPLSSAEVAALYARAKAELPGRVAARAAAMGLAPAGITITHARTRFGSCSAKNRLSFSCFLMANPEDAIDYVIVHELAHIRHKNHGPDFWAAVGEVLPDYPQRRRRLSMPPVGSPR